MSGPVHGSGCAREDEHPPVHGSACVLVGAGRPTLSWIFLNFIVLVMFVVLLAPSGKRALLDQGAGWPVA
ncbi:hypothetical protein ASC82_04080 [Streptomyces sp. Root431]|uniref:hypothetical protein n=1 Tax=Streptomyces sp. Root431 TaxID=1736535 RepID=UPI0006F37B8D|nr:hypothetical protein [Streptomyces sp. Root431]KQX14516.1 hypothetical protein ASC82_04080 [Streptomyces sp. Root431]